jgi:heme exporter protein C
MAGVIISMFLLVPQHQGLGDAGRIIIMHVPTAWVSVVAFAVSAVYSGLYLWRERTSDDDYAVAAAECGFLFTLLATLTGAIFSQIIWGVYWNWDPRQTSIFVLLLIYAALFALRAALDNPQQRRKLSAVFALFAFVTVPFLFFVAPRMADSTLHPNCALVQGSECEGVTLAVGKIGQLGDRKVQLLGLEQQGTLVTAQVEVTEPGLRDVNVLAPRLDLSSGNPAQSPQFPGQRFRLVVEQADVEAGTALLNIEAPGSGILDNRRTLFPFLASLAGFTALFVWMFRLRATVLGIQWDMERRAEVV